MNRAFARPRRAEAAASVIVPPGGGELVKPVAIDQREGCNGCGLCCDRTPCLVALHFVKIPATWTGCPELLWDGVRHWCGLQRWRPWFRKIGAVEPVDWCWHPGNAWKLKPLKNRTVHGRHRIEDYRAHLAEQLLAHYRPLFGGRAMAWLRPWLLRKVRTEKGD